MAGATCAVSISLTLVTMPTFLTRLLGLLLLTVAITIPSCQAVFQRGSSVNMPEKLSPASRHER